MSLPAPVASIVHAFIEGPLRILGAGWHASAEALGPWSWLLICCLCVVVLLTWTQQDTGPVPAFADVPYFNTEEGAEDDEQEGDELEDDR